MTKAQISCFMAVAKYQSFSKAASHLYISQPAVSKQVSLLERDLGLTLIDRTYGTIQLTVAGKMFYEYFEKALLDFTEVMEEARRLTSGHTGDIRLGCLDGWDLSQFYPKMRSFLNEKYPNLHLYLDGYNHSYILDALARGEIDVAITLGITLQGQSELSRREITTARTVMLISDLHPLAHRENLTLRDFKDEPFFVVAPVSGSNNAMHQLTLDLCHEAGFEPRIEHTPNSATILMRLQGGTGVQITCEWTGACRLPLYRVIPLNRKLSISAAWMENDNNPAKHIFINELLYHYSTFEA